MWKEQKKQLLFLTSWFCIFWVVYFSSWMQTLQGRDRFHTSFYPMLILCACYGIAKIERLFSKSSGVGRSSSKASVILVSFLLVASVFWIFQSSRLYTGKESLLETRIPELAKKDVPAGYVVITNWPLILTSTTELKVIDTKTLLGSPGNQRLLLNCDCALFLKDKSCSSGEENKMNCETVMNEFKTTPFATYREGKTAYSFYKLSLKESR
jgi:hypothetical protein